MDSRYPDDTLIKANAGLPNRYPTKRENPTLYPENGVSYTVIIHPFV